MTDKKMSFPQLQPDKVVGPKVVMKINMDGVEFQLFEKQAPMAVGSFVRPAEKGYYDGVIFHRVIKDFMIQGGDPKGDGADDQSTWGHPFEDESSLQLLNFHGAISMANSGPSTNGSQSLIVQNQNIPKHCIRGIREAGYPQEVIKRYKRGGAPWLGSHHTALGQVTKGMDVADTIAKVAANNMDKPNDDVVVEGIIIKK